MDALDTTGFLPSAMLLAVAGGTIVVVVVALLLQRAARTHLQEQRCDQLRKRVTRAEAQWREAAM
jgi:hypothetical protein